MKGLAGTIPLDFRGAGRDSAGMGDEARPDPEVLRKLANWRMPYGRYKGQYLVDLPEPYVVWFSRNGFPEGELGRLLENLYEIKLNGLEELVRPFTDTTKTR